MENKLTKNISKDEILQLRMNEFSVRLDRLEGQVRILESRSMKPDVKIERWVSLPYVGGFFKLD